MVFTSLDNLRNHVSKQHNIFTVQTPPSTTDPILPSKTQNALEKYFQTYRIDLEHETDLLAYMHANASRFREFISNTLSQLGPIKVQLSMAIALEKPLTEDKTTMHANTYSRPLMISLGEDDLVWLMK